MGSGFPPTSGQIPPTSGASDWSNRDPHIGYTAQMGSGMLDFIVAFLGFTTHRK